MRTAHRLLLLACSLCLTATAFSSSFYSHEAVLGGAVAVSRASGSLPVGRRLLDDINAYSLSAATQYLIPTEEPALCTGSSCCQMDDYTTPYRVRMLNSSMAVIGGRTYTTFFMALVHTGQCDVTLDVAGCCGGSVSTIWLDVDPALIVRYASFNGNTASIMSQQSSDGLSITGFNVGAAAFPTAGYPVTVTVEGGVQQLCPLSDEAPVLGYCSTVLIGAAAGSGSAPGACCPYGISQAQLVGAVFVPPADGGFQCSASIAQSAYVLTLQTVGTPYIQDGTAVVDYNFLLSGSSSCDANAVGACCSMVLDGVELKVASKVVVDSVTLGTTTQTFTTSPWAEPESPAGVYQSLLLNDLALAPGSVPTAGLALTVTVQLAGSYAPDLCSAAAAGSAATIGQCEYFLSSGTESTCCPASSTAAVPLPAAVCNPTQSAPMIDTSASLQYYEHTYATDGSSTAFTFLVTDHNTVTAQGGCGKDYCGDVCGWSLFTNASSQHLITVLPDSSNTATGSYVLSPAPNATATFDYGPSGQSTTTYTISMPGRRSLSDLCAPGALAGQGAKACGAVLRTPDFFSVVYFSEADLALPSYPPPPLAQDLCAGTPLPLSSACTRVDTATYNSPASGLQTVFDFMIVNHEDETAPCLADSAVPSPTFTVMLVPAVATLLATSRVVALQPNTAVVVAKQGSVQWSWTPTAQNGSNVMHYSFNVPVGGLTLATACAQDLFFDQPAGSCVVQISGAHHCFRGYITAVRSSSLVWLNTAASTTSSTTQSGAIIGGVLGGFFGLLLIALLAGFAVFAAKRRRQSRALAFSDLTLLESPSRPSQDLQRPLAPSAQGSEGGGSAGGLLRSHSRGLMGSFGGAALAAAPAAAAAAAAPMSRSLSSNGGALPAAAAATAIHRSSSSASGDSQNSAASAALSDIAIQVRRGTMSDAGAPLQPVAPEDVLMSMRSSGSGAGPGGPLAPSSPPSAHFNGML